MIEELEFLGETMEDAWRSLEVAIRRRDFPTFMIMVREPPTETLAGERTPARLVISIVGPE